MMRSLRACAALALLVTSSSCNSTAGTTEASPGPSSLPSTAVMTSNCQEPPEYGGENYCGAPNLANALAFVQAGGGPDHFSTVKALAVLAGPHAAAEKAKLFRSPGELMFNQYVKTSDFAISDALALLAKENVAFPAAASPDSKNGKSLAAALYADGVGKDRRYSADHMLDKLFSHAVHLAVMQDINAKYGPLGDQGYHDITLSIFKDLKAAYGLK